MKKSKHKLGQNLNLSEQPVTTLPEKQNKYEDIRRNNFKGQYIRLRP